jgi:hypothetical protein
LSPIDPTISRLGFKFNYTANGVGCVKQPHGASAEWQRHCSPVTP